MALNAVPALLTSRRIWLVLVVLGVLAVGAVVISLRPDREGARPFGPDEPASSTSFIRALAARPGPATAVASGAQEAPIATARGAVATLAWGSGPGRIGRPNEDEGSGETPLRLSVDSAGGVLLLDPTNDRIVRLGPDGKPGQDLRLPIKEPRDVAAVKDTVLLLDADPQRSRVMLLGPDGKTRGNLPLPRGSAATSRGLVVSGNDVYLEAMNGELTRLGNAQGVADPNPSLVAGRPTRDGRGFLSALIPDPESGRVHVYLVDQPSQQQRFSKLLETSLFVEGIFLIDTSLNGTIYLGITGGAAGNADGPTSAQLLCLEPERGGLIGVVNLPVKIGEEAILDAKALDSGGVTYSVFTEQGLRLERQDCR